jgi:hypothetical protein
MPRKSLYAFAAFQAIGEICQWSWPSAQSTIGPIFWYGALFLLLPGNFLGGYVIEKLFWRTGLTLVQLQLLQVPVALGINLAVWTVGALAWKCIAKQIRRAHRAGDLRL